jgi:phage baseplate assembly protein W
MIIKKQQYSDIPFFISKNSFTGDLNLVKDVSAIRQSVQNIILTNQGERPFDYYFGPSLFQNIFENLTVELILDVQTKIVTNLKKYENRVDVIDVVVTESKTDDYTLNIKIYYFIPDLGINDNIEIGISRNR